MQNPSFPNSTDSGAPVKKRFRLFSLRTFGFCLVGLAVLVTLIALFYAEEDWRGKRAWEKYRREAEARGGELNWSKFIPAAVPDEQNFAMTPFLKPLFDFVPGPGPGKTVWSDTNALARVQNFGRDLLKAQPAQKNETLASVQRTDLPALAAALQKKDPQSITKTEAAQFILQYMRKYQPELDELRAASKLPYSRFNIRYDEENPNSILLPHLANIKAIVQILRIKAEAELALGNSDAAYQDVRFIFYLTDSFRGEPFVISQLVRVATLNIGQRVIWVGLADQRWSESQLKGFQTDLAKISMLKDGQFSMEGERAFFGVRWFEMLHRHSGFRRDNFQDLGLDPGLSFVIKVIPEGWLYMEQVSYLRFFSEKVIPGINAEATQIYPRFTEDALADLEKVKGHSFQMFLHHKIVAQAVAAAIVKINQKFAASQTGVEQTIIACALERYRMANRGYPQTLDSLVPKFLDSIPLDVCDGKPMKYHLTDDGKFVLYSVGWNQKDEDGKVVLQKGKSASVDLNEGDWAWVEYN